MSYVKYQQISVFDSLMAALKAVYQSLVKKVKVRLFNLSHI